MIDNDEDCNDIIGDKPRIKMELWATIYRREPFGQFADGLHETLDKAKLSKDNSVASGEIAFGIARVEIDCVEGENLD